jgi:hypothetical protein
MSFYSNCKHVVIRLAFIHLINMLDSINKTCTVFYIITDKLFNIVDR